MKPLISFLSDLKGMGITLSANGDRLVCNAPKNAVTEEIRKELAARKPAILAFLRDTQASPESMQEIPLSHSQQRLWFVTQLDGSNPVYNVVNALWLTGKVNRDAIERALFFIVERHESLRTGFFERNGQPFAKVMDATGWKMAFLDLTHFRAQNAEAEAERLAQIEGRRPFDLEKPPLLRATLFEVSAQRSLMLLTVHHIVADGWSLGILYGEFAELYAQFSSGKTASLAKLPAQFRDYVRWERDTGKKAADEQMRFWLERLGGELPILELPADRRRPQAQTSNGKRIKVMIDEPLVKRIGVLARETQTTVFMVLLAAFQALLFRYTGIEDVLVGSSTANRQNQEFSTLIGFFVNNLVLRNDLSGNPSFSELLKRVRETAIAAYAHQDVPFERLVESLRPERALNHGPLVQVMFTFQNLPMPKLHIEGLTVEIAEIDPKIARADLAVEIWPREQAYRCDFEYNTDLFDEGTIGQLEAHYVRLLEAVAADASRPIGSLRLLDDKEYGLIVEDWNRTESPSGGNATVPSLFRAQAEASPGAVAVAMGEGSLSYAELDKRSDLLAELLRKRGVRRDVVVGLYVSRGLNMVVGLLAILKAGGAYLPLDPALPAERIEFLLSDADVGLLLTETFLRSTLPETRAALLAIDEPLEESAAPSSHSADEQPRAEDLAYMIYTSGSTGQPKGTEISHGALVNLLSSMQREPGLRQQDRLVAVTTLSFDIAGLEIFGPLVCGARLVLASREQAIDPYALGELVEWAGGTVMQATPSTWRMLVESGWMGKSDLRMWCGGEALSPDLADSLLARGRELWNLYGPTETTIWSAAHRVGSGEDPILIGRPIANTQMYILDGQGEPVPIGVAGELYIAGDGVARGYWRRPELTKSRFVADPFSKRADGRMYRTGDVARYRRDGQIQLLGRTDQQIKLRGHRIELGEIEAVMERHADVQQAVVALDGTGAGQRLVGYIKQAEETPASDLRAWLQRRLPEYMVPGVLLSLRELPLTPNGKVDRKRLPAPEDTAQERSAESVVPRNQLERTLARIWSEVLRVGSVGVRDNFFDLGGHSLLLTTVHAKLRQELNSKLTLLDLFRYPTIESLARAIQKEGSSASPVGTAISTSQPAEHPLSRSQQRLWFLDQLNPGNAVYNISFSLRLKGNLQQQLLGQALKTVLGRHESLRTSFFEKDGMPYARVEDAHDWHMSFVEFSDIAADIREDELLRYIQEEAGRPFALDCGPLFRATLVRTAPEEHALILVVHHIAFDGWSIGVLAREMTELMQALLEKRDSALPAPHLQYRDFVVWEQQQEAARNSQMEYWKKQLAGVLPLLELPTDRPRPPLQSFHGKICRTTISKALADRLERLSREQNATFYIVLFACFNVLLLRYSRQEDILIGTPTAGRLQSEFENLIGFFVNNLVLRTNLSGNPTFVELLRRVRTTVLDALEHQSAPFDQLVEELQPERGLDRSPIFQVMFVLQNLPMQKMRAAGLEMFPVEFESSQARYDLSVTIYAFDDAYRCEFEYNTDLFDEGTIGQLEAHYVRLLEAVAADPSRPIGLLRLLDDKEYGLIVEDWNRTESPSPGNATVPSLFRAQAEATPGAIAVAMGEGSLSYAELDKRSDLLAELLRKRGVSRDVVVGLYVSRGLNMVVGLLGILKAGGAYLPLDPALPAERIEFLLSDADVGLLLTETFLRSTLPETRAALLAIDEPLEESAAPSSHSADEQPRAEDLAYMIYTSGSTGQPKGTEISHGALVNLLSSMQREPGLRQQDRLVAVTTLSFDIAGLEIFGPLVCGARLVLASREQAIDPYALGELVEWAGGTVMQATPSTWRMLVESGWMGKSDLRMWCGGEALSPDLADSLLARGRELWNLYGPTETTIWSAAHRVGSGEDPILIGRPIANTQMYILDGQGEPVPIGVAGELYIAGDGVARGYWRRPELTKSRFVADPFSKRADGRMYRTGDVARYRRDGQIQLLGRTDQQIKLRGHRIELGEIEAVMERHADVQQAVVALDGTGAGQRLVGYIKQAEETPASDLRAWLQRRLPEYMVPGVLLSLRELPLTPNGKVDRKRLPAPEDTAQERSAESVVPRNQLERTLARIWSEVLRVGSVGVRDNFFDLGGHSLLLTTVHAKLRQELALDVPVIDLFRYPTVESMAAHLDRRHQAAVAEGVHS